jgi:hypothetical protein
MGPSGGESRTQLGPMGRGMLTYPSAVRFFSKIAE